MQARLQTQITELDIEIHEEEFPYWRKIKRPGKAK